MELAGDGEVGALAGCLESSQEGRVLLPFPFSLIWGGRSGRTGDISKCPETENVYIGAVKLPEQEIIRMCG